MWRSRARGAGHLYRAPAHRLLERNRLLTVGPVSETSAPVRRAPTPRPPRALRWPCPMSRSGFGNARASPEHLGLEQQRRSALRPAIVAPQEHGRDHHIIEFGQVDPPRIDTGFGRDAVMLRHLVGPRLRRLDPDWDMAIKLVEARLVPSSASSLASSASRSSTRRA